MPIFHAQLLNLNSYFNQIMDKTYERVGRVFKMPDQKLKLNLFFEAWGLDLNICF